MRLLLYQACYTNILMVLSHFHYHKYHKINLLDYYISKNHHRSNVLPDQVILVFYHLLGILLHLFLCLLGLSPAGLIIHHPCPSSSKTRQAQHRLIQDLIDSKDIQVSLNIPFHFIILS